MEQKEEDTSLERHQKDITSLEKKDISSLHNSILPHQVVNCLLDKKSLEKPHIAQRAPYSLSLEAGKEYLYCTCGLSKTQPFCDEQECSDTKFKPLKFIAKKQIVSLICGCKRNCDRAGPYCDGTHRDLSW